MNSLKLIKIISLIVIILAALIIIGWIFDISFLKSILSVWAPMKFYTAVCFLLSGIALYLMTISTQGKSWAINFLSFVVIVIFLLMMTLFVSSLLNVNTGLEDLFIKKTVKTANSLIPGRPSIPTMLAFILISTVGFLISLDQKRFIRKFFIFSIVVIVIGMIPIIGYIVHIPWLCYYISGINSAMSIYSAILFIIFGIGLALLSKSKPKEPTTIITIKSRLTTAFLILGIISVIFLGFISITVSKNALQKEITNKLLLFTEAKNGQIITYLDSLESKTANFSSNDFVEDRVKEIVAADSDSAAADLNEYLINNKKTLDENLFCIMILNPNGKVISSVSQDEIGNDESETEQFINGQKGVFVGEGVGEAEMLSGKSDIFSVSAPIKDKNTGELLGVIVNSFLADKLDQILSGEFQTTKGVLSNSQSSVKTLTIHLVNKEKKVIVHGHKENESPISIIDTFPVQECLNSRKDVAGEYVNHFGNNVIGASVCIVQQSWTLLTEIDSKEASAPLRTLQFDLIIFILIILIFIILMAIITADRISKPIAVLHKGTDIISNGNLDYRVDIKTGDEIQELADAFNEMTAKLKKYNSGLESTIKARTSQLNNKVKELQDAQTAMVNITEDAERDKELSEQEKNKIQAILSSIGDAVFVVDKNLKIIVFNSVIEKLSGYSAKEAIGEHYEEILKFVYEKDSKINNSFVRNVINTGKIKEMSNHMLLVNRAGKAIPITDSASALKDKAGNIIGCVVVFRDITRERQTQELKDEFLNIAAHDLRTPITAVKGYTDMINSGDFGEVNERLRDPLKEIGQASERMMSMVSDFLTISRIERGKINVSVKAVDLTPTLQSLAKQMELLMTKKNLSFDYSGIPEKFLVWTDQEKIQQVIVNLLDNALKYTDKGLITLKAKIGSQTAVISVSDTGKGISPEHLNNLFEKYYQVGDVKLSHGGHKRVVEGKGTGLGLGLYISRLIVERCGGKIWVESELGKGSKFSFSLPVSKQSN